jgi:cytochrome c oxidase subunit 2
MFGLLGAVFVVVVALWLIAIRSRDGARPDQRARRWIIGGGVLLPAAATALILAFGIPAGARMGAVAGDDALVVEVTGQQWWWRVRYPAAGIETANQLVIPAGRPVHIHARSGDVIHAFWVPRLGGKIDMIPGRRNVIQIEADEAGSYRGQCAEFCGAQHARMVLSVEALEPGEFATWLQRRRAIEAPPASKGLRLFQQHCAECHGLRGIASAASGPDLSDVASRPSLGAGVLANEGAASQLRWLREHRELKPGNHMPAVELDETELDVLAAWLAERRP